MLKMNFFERREFSIFFFRKFFFKKLKINIRKKRILLLFRPDPKKAHIEL